MRFGRFNAITCVARIWVISLVPQPKASAPTPPTVLAWLSGTACVAPGSTMPSSGATTCEMPCSGSSMSKSSYAVLARALAHRPQERGAGRIGVVIAAGLGGDGVVLHGEGQIGPVDRPALLLQRRKGMMRVQFVQHVTVDIEQVAAVGALPDQVRIPDFVEQSARHGVGPGADGLAAIIRAGQRFKASGEPPLEHPMPRVVGIDHLVLSVGDFARSKAFYDKLLKISRLQIETRIRRHGRLEQRQDLVLDRRRRCARAQAQISQGRYRLPPLRVRACQPQGGGRARRLSRKERHDRARSAGRVLRRQLLRGLFRRSRRHEARSHDLGAAGKEQAQSVRETGARRPAAAIRRQSAAQART